jgi:hypothetical protein
MRSRVNSGVFWTERFTPTARALTVAKTAQPISSTPREGGQPTQTK